MQVNVGFATYNVDDVSVSDRQLQGAITLFFKRNVWVTRARHAYSFLSMVAEIGGYLGLLLGVSILQAAQAAKNAVEKHD